MSGKFWLAEHADAIFYTLFAALLLGEILLRHILKVERQNVVREYVDSGFAAIVLALIIRVLFIQTFIIPSGSMENTMLIGDQLIVNKIGFGVRMPWQGKKYSLSTHPGAETLSSFAIRKTRRKDTLKGVWRFRGTRWK